MLNLILAFAVWQIAGSSRIKGYRHD